MYLGNKKKKLSPRIKSKLRIRKSITGTSDKPRLSVYKSNRYTYAQVFDDVKGVTLCSASSNSMDFDNLVKNVTTDESQQKITKSNVTGAKLVGNLIATKCKSLGISFIVFDRNGYPYHGRVDALASGAREAGLIF
jgi:large subunit ribosomal protein L18